MSKNVNTKENLVHIGSCGIISECEAEAGSVKEKNKIATENLIESLRLQLEYLKNENQELTKANSLLSEEKNRFEDLYNNSPNGLFTFDSTGYIIDVNHSGSLILRYCKEALLNKLFHLFIVKEYWESFNSFFEKVFVTGHKQTCEIQLINKNGETFWVQLEGVLVNNFSGETQHCRTSLFDISERKQAEKLLEVNQRQLRTAQKIANMGNWTWNLKSNKITWTNQMFRIFGLEPQECEITPKLFLSYIHPDSKDQVTQGMLRTISTGKPFEIDYKIILKKNKVTIVNFRAKSELNDKGEPVNLFGTLQDITDRKEFEEKLMCKTAELKKSKDLLEKKAVEMTKLNEKLQISQKELTELNENKNKFLAIISHNLKNPFSVLLGLTDLLAYDIEVLDKPQIEKVAVKINQSSLRIFNLLNNLLRWSKLQFEKNQYQPEALKLKPAIQNTINLLYDNAAQKKINLSYSVDESIIIYSDNNIFEAILQNLVTNAIKFSFEENEVRIQVTKNENMVEISVIDNGVGMSTKTISNLFKIGKNQTTPGTAQEQGSGLGLIICNELVKRQGGNIYVESEEGRGCKFTFTVPLYEDVLINGNRQQITKIQKLQ